MKKLILLSILILNSFLIFSQKANHIINFEKGTEALDAKKYQEAISFLSLSIDENPIADAYFNRAIAYFDLGDTCIFCKDLKKASNFGDKQAEELYSKNCLISIISNEIPDSIKSRYPDVTQLKTVHQKCSSEITVFGVIGNSAYSKPIRLSELKNSALFADKVEVFTIVENMPQYPGGENARNQLLATNIIYPSAATKYGIQGTVYISFIVENDGTVSNVKVLRGIGGGCDEESVRVVKLMPKWTPGTQKGKPVRVLFNMPIYYKLQR